MIAGEANATMSNSPPLQSPPRGTFRQSMLKFSRWRGFVYFKSYRVFSTQSYSPSTNPKAISMFRHWHMTPKALTSVGLFVSQAGGTGNETEDFSSKTNRFGEYIFRTSSVFSSLYRCRNKSQLFCERMQALSDG